MSLLEKLIIPEDYVMSREYYETLESHLKFLIENSLTKTFNIAANEAAIYKGDFYGLLNSLGVDKKYHYPIMRVNGYLSSSDYDGLRLELIRPAESVINSIITIYLSVEES